MFQPVETVRVGLAYRSTSRTTPTAIRPSAMFPMLSLSTMLSAWQLQSDMKVRIKTPDTITLSATWEATDALRLSGTARWSKWSNFKSLFFLTTAALATGKPSIGLQLPIRPSPTIPADAIVVLLPSVPTTSSTASGRSAAAWPTTRGRLKTEYRMAVIPDTDRVWFSGGASYKYTDNLTFDFGATYIKGVGDKELRVHVQPRRPPANSGQLDSYIFSAQMQYLF